MTRRSDTIRRVVLHNFKRFDEVTFDLSPVHIVLAGPNDSGKTTLLQAICAWNLGLRRWREVREDELDERIEGSKKHRGEYTKVPLARQAFVPVPLRTFDLLWHRRKYKEPLSITIEGRKGWSITIEFIPDTTEQIYVRPKRTDRAKHLEDWEIDTAFVPPMSGVAFEEPAYANRLTLDAMLARMRSGDVLRNLLVLASQDDHAWRSITDSVKAIFGYELLPPDPSGAFIRSEYRDEGTSFDLLSAGSGFQQVLMLLCFLHTKKDSVLLLDEPDAHLHVILQDAIYNELKAVAARSNSQLVIATHSEIIVNAAELDEIRVAFDPGKLLTDPKMKQNVAKALRWVTNIEIAQAKTAPGILYLEGHTDLEILRAWATVLEHRSLALLTTELFWRKAPVESPSGQEGISAKLHYDALTLVRELPGLVLIDGDARETIKSTPITGKGLQRLRWRRYEIESYLVHPVALARYVEHATAPDSARTHVENLERYFADNLTPAVLRDPLGDHAILRRLKAREEILPPALEAAGLLAFPYTRYHEIAAMMKSDEIHPEVIEKLDAICKAFAR